MTLALASWHSRPTQKRAGTAADATRVALRAAQSVIVSLALAAAPGAVKANPVSSPLSPAILAMSVYALCWHTGAGVIPELVIECDPPLLPRPLAPILEDAEPASLPATAPIATKPPVPRRPTPMSDTDTLFSFQETPLNPVSGALPAGMSCNLIDIDADADSGAMVPIGHTVLPGGKAGRARQPHAAGVRAVALEVATQEVRAAGGRAKHKQDMPAIGMTDDCGGNKSARMMACPPADRHVEVDGIETPTAR